MIGAWLKQWKAKRKQKQLERAVKTVESYGFTVAEISTKAGTDYIRASDGSWRKIGRGDVTTQKITRRPDSDIFFPELGY